MKFAIFLKSSLLFSSCIVFFFINKTLRLNNLKARPSMNTKTSVLVIGVKAIIYLLLYDLHDFTFNLESVSISKVHWCRFENLSICLCSYKKNFSYISRTHISKSKRCINVKCSTYYFHMKTKILADFQICISVPLILLWTFLIRTIISRVTKLKIGNK